jgi:hypothetical protein
VPYIQAERRPAIAEPVERALAAVDNPGDLNFAITKLCLGYLAKDAKPSYRAFNTVMGVLTCAALELYRAHVARHEDRARVWNGPVT